MNHNRAILLLEGGAFRSLYTGGVLDALMKHNLRLDALGVSAGALMGLNYISNQPGRSRQLNLAHRHDPDYVGKGALRRDRGMFGFDYLFHEMSEEWPFDEETFFHSPQKFYAVATNCQTGAAEFFDRDAMGRDIFTAVAASASLPGMATPVKLGSYDYLDGGASVAIPVWWAMNQGYEKIVVVRTRDRAYRKPPIPMRERMLYNVAFAARPLLRESLMLVNERYNMLMETLLELESAGRIFVLAPEEPVTVTRLEGDLEKLQQLYLTGYRETEAQLNALKAYLASGAEQQPAPHRE